QGAGGESGALGADAGPGGARCRPAMGVHAVDAERRRRCGGHDRGRQFRHAMMSKLRRIAVLVLVLPVAAHAQDVAEEVPIVGGTAATARALGVDVVPDRPRFLAELVRVIYDAREGKSVETDAKLARLANHRTVTERFQSAIAGMVTTAVSLNMASTRNERTRLE